MKLVLFFFQDIVGDEGAASHDKHLAQAALDGYRSATWYYNQYLTVMMSL